MQRCGDMYDAMQMLSNLYLMAAENDSNDKDLRSDALRAIRKLEVSGKFKFSRHAEASSQESQEYL